MPLVDPPADPPADHPANRDAIMFWDLAGTLIPYDTVTGRPLPLPGCDVFLPEIARHFRLETDTDGWWIVPGPGTQILPFGFETSALKCGPGSDPGCASLDIAPVSGYETNDVSVAPLTTYVMKVRGDDGATRYAAIRVTMQGFDQIAIGAGQETVEQFDHAYLGTQMSIHRAQFKTDIATTHNKQGFGYIGQFERASRIHDTI